MINEYVVRFRKGREIFELHISANDREQAIQLAEIQSKYSKMGRGKFEFVSIRGENEEDTYLKDIFKHSFTIK